MKMTLCELIFIVDQFLMVRGNCLEPDWNRLITLGEMEQEIGRMDKTNWLKWVKLTK